MDIIQSYSPKPEPEDISLVYLAKPIYGGWVTFTVHLVKQFNSFYQSCSIVGKQPVNSFRLILSKKVGDQIKLSMSLLGIDCPERM